MKAASAAILALVGMVSFCLPALAEDEVERRPVSPYDCTGWIEHIDELKASDQPLERELGELYGEPDLQFCQVQSERVTETREPDWNLDWLDWSGLAWLMRALAIALMLGLIIWLAWRWRQHLDHFRSRRDSRKPLPGPETHSTPTKSVLPEDIPGAALDAWQAGDQRLAMSLLYRGAVASLLPDKRLRETRTEREVIAALQHTQTEPETLAWMKTLVNGWLGTAWANRPPTDDEFLDLQRQWSRHCHLPSGVGR